MVQRWIGAAIAGACLAAAAPAMADSSEAAASPKAPDSYRPLVIDPKAKVEGARTVGHPMILNRPASPDVFGTVALNAGVTFYDARFRRVSNTDTRDPMVMRLASTVAGLDPIAQLRQVQQDINSRIKWSHDLENMGVADFWANAGETLKRGTGDSEDIAIVKMQVLKAAGFDPKDLYISIGRHNMRGAHVLLLARTAAGFFVLDDQARDVMAASQGSRFTPIMTLGQGMSWIHGRRVSAPRVASASTGATRAKAK